MMITAKATCTVCGDEGWPRTIQGEPAGTLCETCLLKELDRLIAELDQMLRRVA